MGVGGIGVGSTGIKSSINEQDKMNIAMIEISIIVFFIVAPSSFLIC
jgi:hypothetical protein